MMVAPGRAAPGCSDPELLPRCAGVEEPHAVRCCADNDANVCFGHASEPTTCGACAATLTCQEIGWEEFAIQPAGAGNSTACPQPQQPACASVRDYRTALQECTRIGARLCTAGEIIGLHQAAQGCAAAAGEAVVVARPNLGEAGACESPRVAAVRLPAAGGGPPTPDCVPHNSDIVARCCAEPVRHSSCGEAEGAGKSQGWPKSLQRLGQPFNVSAGRALTPCEPRPNPLRPRPRASDPLRGTPPPRFWPSPNVSTTPVHPLRRVGATDALRPSAAASAGAGAGCLRTAAAGDGGRAADRDQVLGPRQRGRARGRGPKASLGSSGTH